MAWQNLTLSLSFPRHIAPEVPHGPRSSLIFFRNFLTTLPLGESPSKIGKLAKYENFKILQSCRYYTHFFRNRNPKKMVKEFLLYDKYFLNYSNKCGIFLDIFVKFTKNTTFVAISQKVFVVDQNFFRHFYRLLIPQKMSIISTKSKNF